MCCDSIEINLVYQYISVSAEDEYLDYIVETHTAQPVVISPISDKVSGANIGLARELNRRKYETIEKCSNPWGV